MKVSSEIAPKAIITSDTFDANASNFGSRIALESSSYLQESNEYASKFIGGGTGLLASTVPVLKPDAKPVA